MGKVDGREPDGTFSDAPAKVGLATIVREWGRIGCIGFGGPPTHIALLRRLCVTERKCLSAEEFEDGISATNLLPGPASTQLAIFCGWRLRGVPGAVAGVNDPTVFRRDCFKPNCATTLFNQRDSAPSSQGRSIVMTSWPASCSSGDNRSQHQAPCQLPCTNAKVAMR
jgi:hypothetical protein